MAVLGVGLLGGTDGQSTGTPIGPESSSRGVQAVSRGDQAGCRVETDCEPATAARLYRGADLDALHIAAAWVLSLMVGVATPEGSLPSGIPGSVVPRVQPDVVVGAASNLQAIICDPRWEWSCEWALRTVYGGAVGCPNGESGGDAHAVGSQWYRGELWYFYGLWQIASRLSPDHPDIQFLFEPFLNTVEAHLKYTAQGRVAWSICGAP